MAQFEFIVTDDRRIENSYMNNFDTWNVQFDKKVTTVRFTIPRYWDGGSVDLADNNLYVNAKTADGKHFPQTAMTIVSQSNADIVVADWKIDRNLTQYSGDFSFLICAKSFSDGNVVEAWHSHVYDTATIAQGIEPQEADETSADVQTSIQKEIASIKSDIATIKQALGIGGS